MSTRGWHQKEVSGPRGAWTTTALVRKGNPARGSVAQNVRFSPGKVSSREGTSAVFSSAGKVTGLFNWISPSENLLLYQDGSTIKRRKLSDGTTDDAVTGLSTTRAPSFADLGPRAYFCGFDTSGTGTMQCRIHDGNYTSGSLNVDVAFRGPLTFSAFTAVDTGTGFCTKGAHKIAFIFQSRSGFAGQPSPVSAGAFAPVTVTLNAGQRTIRASVTLNTPADAGLGCALFPIMTRADNPNNWFFVPETFYAPDPLSIPASTGAWSFFVDISISDEDLANRAESANDQFNRMVAGASSGPFNPNFVAAYGKRMTYGVGVDVYVSEIDDPQAITADFNRLNLPSQRKVGMGFQIGQAYYLTGDKWTGRTSDTGDLPSTWPQPEVISDSIGAQFPNCVEPRTAGGYAWIAAESGLYVFDGKYPNRQISYLQGDIWDRINWSAAYAIQIADDVTSLKCYVAVPLDGATEPTHLLVYDYTNGLAYDTCDFGFYLFSAATFSAIRMVKENSTSRSVLYIGPSAAGSVLHLDESTHNDAGAAIDCIWESSYVRGAGEIQSKTIRVGNMDLWVRGAGTLALTWYGLDRATNVQPMLLGNGMATTTLSSAPGIIYGAKGDLSPVENYSVRFRVNQVNGWLEVSGFTAYARPALWVR